MGSRTRVVKKRSDIWVNTLYMYFHTPACLLDSIFNLHRNTLNVYYTKGMILVVTNGVVIVLVSCSTAMIRLSALEVEELISCGAT